jgi:hypothetical protein
MYIRRALAQIKTTNGPHIAGGSWVVFALIGLLAAMVIGVSGYAYKVSRQAIHQLTRAHFCSIL